MEDDDVIEVYKEQTGGQLSFRAGKNGTNWRTEMYNGSANMLNCSICERVH